jgi:hypothetical protein
MKPAKKPPQKQRPPDDPGRVISLIGQKEYKRQELKRKLAEAHGLDNQQ